MPNPYDDQELKRQAQVGMLKGPPVSTTMPMGGMPQIEPMAPVRHEPSAGNARGDFLQLAGRFSPNPSGLDALFSDQEFRTRFPKAAIHKNDWVNLGEGSGLIDTIRGFDRNTNAGEGWQWLTEADAIKNKAAQRPQAMGINPALDNSSLARIMAELTAASQDEQSPAAREAVLQMLQGGL